MKFFPLQIVQHCQKSRQTFRVMINKAFTQKTLSLKKLEKCKTTKWKRFLSIFVSVVLREWWCPVRGTLSIEPSRSSEDVDYQSASLHYCHSSQAGSTARVPGLPVSHLLSCSVRPPTCFLCRSVLISVWQFTLAEFRGK